MYIIYFESFHYIGNILLYLVFKSLVYVQLLVFIITHLVQIIKYKIFTFIKIVSKKKLSAYF